MHKYMSPHVGMTINMKFYVKKIRSIMNHIENLIIFKELLEFIIEYDEKYSEDELIKYIKEKL